jgi:apolipoprotein N-acyltransferase
MAVRVLRHPVFLSVLSGLLLSLSFPPADIGPLAFVAIVPLLIAIDGAKPGAAFRLGLWTGFVFFAIVYSWIPVFASGKAGLLGTFAGYLLAAIMGLFIAVFAWCVASAQGSCRLNTFAQLLLAPSVWVILEYVRQLGSLGMGWGDLGYTQWRDPILLRIAPLTGVWGMSWAIAVINAAFATRRLTPIALTLAAIGAVVLIGPLGKVGVRQVGARYGAASLQANINQDVPWNQGRPADPVYYAQTLDTFDSMAAEAKGRGAKLALLAETATPGYVRFDFGLRSRVQAISTDNGLVLVAGGRDTDMTTRLDRNVAVLFTPWLDPDPMQMYAKQQLVPFGEFVPFVQYLQWLSVLRMANFDDEAGAPNQPPLNAGDGIGKIGVAICYESSYPRYTSRQVRMGANILTVITDDTWFGKTAAARQHYVMSAVRAAECDRYLVRCAATGISGIFAPTGAELAEAGLFQKQVVEAPVASLAGETLFVRFGDWVVVLSAVFATGCVLAVALPRK